MIDWPENEAAATRLSLRLIEQLHGTSRHRNRFSWKKRLVNQGTPLVETPVRILPRVMGAKPVKTFVQTFIHSYHIYIYIYIDRERCMCIYIYIYTHAYMSSRQTAGARSLKALEEHTPNYYYYYYY